MFDDFDPSLLDSPEFKEDSVREVIILPLLQRLGYKPSGQNRILRSKTLVHPYIYVGTRKHPVTIIPDYSNPIWCVNVNLGQQSAVSFHQADR